MIFILNRLGHGRRRTLINGQATESRSVSVQTSEYLAYLVEYAGYFGHLIIYIVFSWAHLLSGSIGFNTMWIIIKMFVLYHVSCHWSIANAPLRPKIFSLVGGSHVAGLLGGLVNIPAHMLAAHTSDVCAFVHIYMKVHTHTHKCSFVLSNFPSEFGLEL